jgi:hypothetical protein
LSTPSTLPRLAAPANGNFTDNSRRARYGVAYLRALCATAGVGLAETSPDEDVDAIDATIKFARASAEVQVKCTSGFRVGTGSATLALEPGWVSKWSEALHPVFVVLVKVPLGFHEWIDFEETFTSHRTVAFGKRFEKSQHSRAMTFSQQDQLTADTLYEWRDQVYAHHERPVDGVA